jgi:uncharacterized glyoxalase superfamily protein PhnB
LRNTTLAAPYAVAGPDKQVAETPVEPKGEEAMGEKAVPMIHVPDVRATVNWYQNIGFTVLNTYGNDGDVLSFAILSFGSSEVMFNQGGHPSTQHRREVDLYIYAENVDALYQRLGDQVEIVEAPHDTFYGMREFIIRDLNRFWVTFGQESTFARLMIGVWKGATDLVRKALDVGDLKPETLTAALAAAGDNKTEIVEMLKQAGATPPAEVDPKILNSYAGKYKDEQGAEFNVILKDGQLCAALGNQQPLRLMALDQATFRPIAFDNYGTLNFIVESGKTVGCAITHGNSTMELKRVVEAG